LAGADRPFRTWTAHPRRLAFPRVILLRRRPYGVLVVVMFAYSTRSVWRALAPAAAAVIVVSIGMSRLYRGMHYPSDVVGGILFGLLWLTVTSLVILHGHIPRETRSTAIR
jgi:membrane-associated phospholipid phosphatase